MTKTKKPKLDEASLRERFDNLGGDHIDTKPQDFDWSKGYGEVWDTIEPDFAHVMQTEYKTRSAAVEAVSRLVRHRCHQHPRRSGQRGRRGRVVRPARRTDSRERRTLAEDELPLPGETAG